ncbi:MAG: NAD(P)H-dependent oxidoreductase [Ferrovibrio sp.]|uniref:NAD(P)H-dependent oxidoreductase n=1 Tax=Ferrovibrio sp. TaxID=1917215 RepID=UPI0026060F20|nr:NAD(P)H-dependent oxidoreductase [Ferrovibrio sp.]MCW0236222.1 NAD(P)H-dependent oxidoreductase [Ferrovibrio sp.]
MRVLVLYAHPVETSFHAALHHRVIEALRAAGHDVDDCDLYAEGFNPVLSREERLNYHNTAVNQAPVQPYVDRLLAAEALVLCFPVWCFGLPAILKGWFDRVLMPGVAFDISDPADVKPALTHLKKIAAVTTYGRPRWMAFFMGDPPRKVITRYLRALAGGRRVDYLACYHMNVATPDMRRRHLDRIGAAMRRF